MPRRNLLLASLSEGDAAAIRPYLVSVQLVHKRVLFEAGDTIKQVYFPEGAIISLVVGLSTGEMVEAAMVGKDGVVGASCALDGKISLSRAIVQRRRRQSRLRRGCAQGRCAAKSQLPIAAHSPRTDSLFAGPAIDCLHGYS